MSPHVALLDANVLYSAPMRDLLLQVAVAGLFEPRWSAGIQREWIEALLQKEPSRNRPALERTRDLMAVAFGDAMVAGHELLVPSLALPDAGDRHVLAAAIIGHCDVIVTQNLKHFPATALAPFEIVAMHPDEFLNGLLDLAPSSFCSAAHKVRARLKNPPVSVDGYLDRLAQLGLVATAAKLGGFADLL